MPTHKGGGLDPSMKDYERRLVAKGNPGNEKVLQALTQKAKAETCPGRK